MSPVGSGISSQIMLKKETTWNTRVVPTIGLEAESEGGVRQQKYLESRQPMRAGRMFQSGSRRVLTTHDASLPINGQITNKDFGSIIDLLHGNTVTPVQQAATTAYLQTHNIGATDPNKSATIQIGKPDTGGAAASGTVRPFDYTGCMVGGFTMSVAVDDWWKFAATFDAADEDTSQTLATASYATALEGFHFQETVVTVNSVVQNLTTGSLVTSASLDLSMPRATERYGLRSTATKAKPILNDYTPGSGTLGFEFTDMTQYTLFTAGTKVPLILALTGVGLAGTAIPYSITMTMAQVQFTGTTPVVAGPDRLMFDAPFVILDDGTNVPVKIEIIETRTTAL